MKKISIITSKKYLKSKNYESLTEILKSNDIEYEIVNIDENIDLKITNSNLILSVGGDGTALRAMKIAWLSKLPVLNIGSGRIGYLVNSLNDIDFNKIIAVTFTNKAAREMKERIANIVGDEAKNLWMGTFHSVFARILRIEAHKIGYTSNFTIYDLSLIHI